MNYLVNSKMKLSTKDFRLEYMNLLPEAQRDEVTAIPFLFHLFPFRTEKLNLSAPMVLHLWEFIQISNMHRFSLPHRVSGYDFVLTLLYC